MSGRVSLIETVRGKVLHKVDVTLDVCKEYLKAR